jgi:hypothetical protein
MIDITYSNEIKVETKDLNKIFESEFLPLKLEIRSVVSDSLIWKTKLNSFMWASFPNTEMNNVRILDNRDNVVYQYEWDVMKHGSVFYKSLWMYCQKIKNSGRTPNGLAIGTHDGEFGEWCPAVKDQLTNVLLVEASEKQYQKLVENYKGKVGVKLLKELITVDGKEVEFFEGGRGYTNSVVERVIRDWETEEIESSFRESTSFNKLIESNFTKQNLKLDWIHLDVEGLDVKLLLSLNKENVPNFIIFEDNNLTDIDRNEIQDWIIKNNFESTSQQGITLLTR